MCLRACVSLCVLLNQPGHPPSGTWLVTSAVTAESPNSGQDKLCPTGETPPVAGGGGAGHSASAQTSELKKLSHGENCSKVSWEQHTPMGISGDGNYHAYVFSVPASAPVCGTEYVPLIAEGLALHPLFLLSFQPSICTLLHKLNLNQMEKKRTLQSHRVVFGFTRCNKRCKGL